MMDKRIVLRHMTGAWIGISQIQGTESQLRTALNYGTNPLPARVEDVTIGDHKGNALLVSHRDRYIVYEEEIPYPWGELLD